MTDTSWNSSGFSFDEDQIKPIVDPIRTLLKQYFTSKMALEDALTAIGALLYAVQNQRCSFRNNIEFLNFSVDVLLNYGITNNVLITFSDKDSPLYETTRKYFQLISEMICIYNGKQKSIFFTSFYEIFNSILDKGEYKIPSLISPRLLDNTLIKQDFLINFYLELIYWLYNSMIISDHRVLEIFMRILYLNNDFSSYLVMKCLSILFPNSIKMAFSQYRLVIYFIINKISSVSKKYHDIDAITIDAFLIAVRFLPNQIKLLIGKELMLLLNYLKDIPDKVMGTIFRQIQIFIEADHSNAKFASSFILKIFPKYYQNDAFLDFCKSIILIDPSFENSIQRLFCCETKYTPAFIKLIQSYIPIFDNLTKYSFDTFYEMCSLIDDIPDSAISYLRSLILQHPPKPDQIEPLMRFVPKEILSTLQQYPPEVIFKVFNADRRWVSPYRDDLLRYAIGSKSIPLISLIYICLPSEEAKQLLLEYKEKLESWEYPIYMEALDIIITEDDKNNIKGEFDSNSAAKLPDDLIFKLLEKKQVQSLINMTQSEILCKKILKDFFIAIDAGGTKASVALCTMKRIDTIKEIIDLHRYEVIPQLFKLAISEEKAKNYRFKDMIKTFRDEDDEIQSLIAMKADLLPPLFEQKEYETIMKYIAKIRNVDVSTLTIEDMKDEIESILPDILCYLLSYVERKPKTEALKKMTEIFQSTSSKLVKQCLPMLSSNLLICLGHPEKKIRNNARKGIVAIVQVEDEIPGHPHPDPSDPVRVIKYFWEKNFLFTIFQFSRIIAERKSSRKIITMRSLHGSIVYLPIQTYYPKITSIIDMAMKYPYLRKYCFLIWEACFRTLKSTNTIKTLFGHVISQILPYYDEYPSIIKRIFEQLIVENGKETKVNFADIAHIPIFKEKPELKSIYTILQSETQIKWTEQIRGFSSQLSSSSPAFKHHLLQQLLYYLKNHSSELNELGELNIKELYSNIWNTAQQDSDHENVLMCARCMSLLPYVKDISPPEIRYIDHSQEQEIIICLITDYLVKILQDSSSIVFHDHSAFVIQELLKQLGCNELDKDEAKPTPPSPSRRKRGQSQSQNIPKKNCWEKFPDQVQSIIDPFRRSQFLLKDPILKKDRFDPIANLNRKIDYNTWLSSFTTELLAVSKTEEGQSKIFYHCSCVINDSPPLCKFILPYLIAFNKGNSGFVESLRGEFRSLLKLLDVPRMHSFAVQAMRTFFQLFDTLITWEISASTTARRANWFLLNIASDMELADAAFKCELYARALLHLEYELFDQKDFLPKYEKFLCSIYQHLEDPDTLDLLKEKVEKHYTYDDTFSIQEIQSFSEQDQASHLKLIKDMLKCGRYERALKDASSFKPTMQNDPELDSLIACSAIRLANWEELSQLSNDHPSDNIETCLGRLLYFIRTKNIVMFEEELSKARNCLIPKFNESMISFYRMLPVLSVFHLLEEIEEWPQTGNINNWGKWVLQIPLTVESVETIIAVRCALIDIAESNTIKKGSEQSEQWLQLAKMCRKSGSLFKSEVFCTRARKLSSSFYDQTLCGIEIAKVYYARERFNQAISILDSSNPTIDPHRILSEIDASKLDQLRAKMQFLKAKWSGDNNLLDLNEVILMFKDATAVLKRSGKALLSLATLADQRVISYIQYIETLNSDANAEKTPVRRTGITKFWGSASSPNAMALFLKEQIPLALENYLMAIMYTPQYSHEVIPRVLELYFDIGKIFTYKNDDENVNGYFDKLSKNQKESVLNSMTETVIKKIPGIPSVVWLNALTQLISLVEQPKPLEGVLFDLIKISIIYFPQPSLWQLMQIQNSTSTNRPMKLDMIWEYVKKDTTSEKFSELNLLREKFHLVTTHIITLIGQSIGATKSKSFRAGYLCPKLVDELCHSNILLPKSSTLTTSPNDANPTATMSNSPTIVSMDEDIYIIKSLQKPRRISVHASDGVHYHFLCKRDDDLRKDMRLMEFAAFLNRILSGDRRSHQRELSLCTFAIICLNEKCGMIEWVENTLSFRTLVEQILKEQKKGLKIDELKQYFDYNHGDAQTNITVKQENFKNKVLPAFPPVLHLWFASHFKDVARWFQSRLIYTRSVAVWSIVGFVVGLGDRHAENIMIDVKTGRCVHVDFNCLFDRAKTLQIPECVPFRLTQNIVDGMGILGTDGTFSESCKLVVEILRAKKQKLMSVLQTFVHDPLLEWKKGSRASTEMTARLTLKEVERRLAGFSEDRTSIHSPECQVKELIKQATDNNRLALMFLGWQPYY